jgi:hypothetical protein
MQHLLHRARLLLVCLLVAALVWPAPLRAYALLSNEANSMKNQSNIQAPI